ncbi:PaaI family thioesterase [Sphingomonas sp. M1-B02]|uniref:PaaI family thioesterase n=1 Tax=Sphingomonas sp. M1-B02 TaxID=3114300 RepID=UPI00224075C6|nr:PaaI family thioesterase [Sphingomonas sp. S6-11]UZK65688.1 PaaI family thioesterase [Sphingomonas sp. S6-11]
MSAFADAHFRYDDDPDLPGWKRWEMLEEGRFNAFIGALSVRQEGKVARVRTTFGRQHSNLRDHIHGGALTGFIDMALFAAGRGFGVLSGPASTLDLSVQFISGGAIDVPTEAHVELLRETGRLLFLRGTVVQEDVMVASFLGTVRKPSIK